MEPNLVSILGFGAAVIIGGLIMVAVSLFSMDDTSYETVVKKKRQAIGSVSKETMKPSKPKREHNRRKQDVKKLKGQGENQNAVLQLHDKLEESISEGVGGPLNKQSLKTEIKAKESIKDDAKIIENVTNKQSSKDDGKSKESTKKRLNKTKKETSPEQLSHELIRSKRGTTNTEMIQISTEEESELPFIEINRKENKRKQEALKFAKKDTEAASDLKTKTVKSVKKEKTLVSSTNLEIKNKNKKLSSLEPDHGDGTQASKGLQKEQFQKQLNLKSMEIAEQNLELIKSQEKIKNLLKDLELRKTQEKNLRLQVDQMEQELSQRSNLLEKKIEEKNKLLVKQQNQHNAVDLSGTVQQLKDENEILRATIQANANQVSDKERYQHEIQLLQAKVDDSLRIHKEFESKVSNYSELLAQKQSESAKLLNQVVMLTEENEQRSMVEKDFADTKNELEQRLIEMDANEAQKAEKVAKLHTQNKDLLKQVKDFELQLQSLKDELIQQKANTSKMLDEQQNMQLRLSEKNALIGSMKCENETLKQKLTSLDAEIEKLKKKNNELRERNWKAMDAVAATEKSCKDKIAANKDEFSENIKVFIQNVRLQLEQGFPSATASGQDFSLWLSEFILSANDSINQKVGLQFNQDHSLRIEQENVEYKKRNKQLECCVEKLESQSLHNEKEIEKYKSILHSTENILQSLQSGVENEEYQKAAFNEKKELELIDAKKDLELKSQLLKKAQLQYEKLETEVKKIKQLSSEQLNQTHHMGNNQEDQGFLIIDQIEQSSETQQQNEEISKLKERLDKEKALTKSLGAAANKLQSVLKQTQEELNKEREKNKSSTTRDE